MFRTLIRHSQRFAWLMLLAAMAAASAPAQAQVKKATIAEQRPDFAKPQVCCRDLKKKHAERVAETDKPLDKKIADQQVEQRGIAVGERTGSTSKQGAPADAKDKEAPIKNKLKWAEKKGKGQKESDLRIPTPTRPRDAALPAANDTFKAPPVTGGPQRQVGSLDVPQRTKDAIGSPQKAKQKAEIADPPADPLKKKREAKPATTGPIQVEEKAPVARQRVNQ